MTYKQLLDKLADMDRRLILLEDYWLKTQPTPKPKFTSGTVPESLWINEPINPQDAFK